MNPNSCIIIPHSDCQFMLIACVTYVPFQISLTKNAISWSSGTVIKNIMRIEDRHAGRQISSQQEEVKYRIPANYDEPESNLPNVRGIRELRSRKCHLTHLCYLQAVTRHYNVVWGTTWWLPRVVMYLCMKIMLLFFSHNISILYESLTFNLIIPLCTLISILSRNNMEQYILLHEVTPAVVGLGKTSIM